MRYIYNYKSKLDQSQSNINVNIRYSTLWLQKISVRILESQKIIQTHQNCKTSKT